MKKKIFAVISAALILTAAGCGASGEPSATSGSEEKKTVTEVAFNAEEEKDDTTDEAIGLLKEKAPHYSEFLKIRRGLPLIFETEVTRDGSVVSAGIYIRDYQAIAVSSYDAEGYETRVLYKGDMLYEISEKDQLILEAECSPERIAEIVDENRLTINADEVRTTSFTSSEKALNGVTYDVETMLPEAAETGADYYYDKTTGELCYIVYGGAVNKIVTLKNEVKESKFELPSGYKRVDYNDYFNSEINSGS